MIKNYLLTSIGYALVGLVLGIYMSAIKDHSQMVTHAHIMLLGFVSAFVFAVLYKLWLQDTPEKLAKIQFITYQVGSLSLFVCLFLMFTNAFNPKIIGPLLGVSSILVLISFVVLKVQIIKAFKK